VSILDVNRAKKYTDTRVTELTGLDFGSVNTEITNVKTDVDSLTTQLAEMATKKQVILGNGFTEYGIIKMPSDFPLPVSIIPFNLFRGRDNRITHDFLFDKFYNDASAGHVYIDAVNGNETADGLTVSTPVKYFTRVEEIINSLANTHVIVHFIQSVFPYVNFNNKFTYTFTKNLTFKADSPTGKLLFTSGRMNNTYTWTADGLSYKTNRTSVSTVYDNKFNDFYNLPYRLKKMSSIQEVKDTPGSWYTDGTTVWIRRLDDTIPNNDFVLQMPLGFNVVFNIHGQRLVTENNKFLFESTSGASFTVAGDSVSRFYANKNAYAHSKIGNGFSGVKLGGVYHFESVAYETYLDGFNYHATTPMSLTPYEFAFNYDCDGWSNGDGTKGTCNAFTAHEGMTAVIVNSIGRDTHGPVLANVNGCYSIIIDNTMYNSLLSGGATKAAFYFDDVNAVKQGKAYLINCEGGGNGSLSINSDGITQIYIKNFKGTNIPDGLAYTILD
jgi:hypothetical protein